MICQIWHRPIVDVFATKINNKLPLYVSPVPENLCLPSDCSSPRVARDELVLGPDRFFHKTSTSTSTLGNSSQTAIQSKVSPKSTIPQSSCLASGLENKFSQKFSVAERNKAPQRFSSRRVYESRWAIFESWCKENQVDFKQPSLLNSRFFGLSLH